MKIVSQTAEEMLIKHGNKSPILLGCFLVLFGSLIFLPNSSIAFTTYPVYGALILAGLSIILFWPSITTNINKNTGKMIVDRNSLLRKKRGEYNLVDINRVEFREPRSSWMNNKISYQAVIVMNDRTEIPLENSRSYSHAMNLGLNNRFTLFTRKHDISYRTNPQEVAKFLGVPFQESDSWKGSLGNLSISDD